MTPSIFKKKWDDVGCKPGEHSLQRVDNLHPLDFYFGYDAIGDREFVLFTRVEPDISLQCDSIQISLKRRADAIYAICFTLIKPSHASVFAQLCWDLFEFTNSVASEEKGMELVKARFKIWQQMLNQGTDGLLPTFVIRGLIGELLFLTKKAVPQYGMDKAIGGWIGIDGADRDFVFNDYWFEIKAIDPSARIVHISSIEQLDTDVQGYLVTVKMQKTSVADAEKITLLSIINDIRSKIQNDIILSAIFESKLISAGYMDRVEYENYAIAFEGFGEYFVEETFPRIRRANLNEAITSLQYDIDLPSIASWKK